MNIGFLATGLLCLPFLTSSSVKETGVTPTTILLGQACALNGPAAGLGKGIKTGLDAYFATVNAKGGINGRQIELRSINDGYDPKKTGLVTETLIDKVGVFALIGGVGTPTSMVAVPLAEAGEVPYLTPMTGAEFLRSPFKKWVVNLRGSYFAEMERQAQYFVDKLGFERVACFYQNDGYGKAGLAGIEQALERRGMKLCATGNYERNTLAVATGLKEIASTSPQAIVMVGAYTSCAAFIKAAKKTPETQGAIFSNLSFVGTNNLLSELGPDSEGCVVTQVVPFPWDTQNPLVKEYHEVMKAAGKSSEIGFLSLEGYLDAKLFCSVASQVDGELTRESFVDTVTRVGSFDLGGVTLTFGQDDHQGLDDIWMTIFHDGKVEPLQ